MITCSDNNGDQKVNFLPQRSLDHGGEFFIMSVASTFSSPLTANSLPLYLKSPMYSLLNKVQCKLQINLVTASASDSVARTYPLFNEAKHTKG